MKAGLHMTGYTQGLASQQAHIPQRTQNTTVCAAGHAASVVGAASLALALLLLPPHVQALAPEHVHFRSHTRAM